MPSSISKSAPSRSLALLIGAVFLVLGLAAADEAPMLTSAGVWTPEIEAAARQEKFDRLVVWADELPEDAFLDVVPTADQRRTLISGRTTLGDQLAVVGVHVPMERRISMGGREPADYRAGRAAVASGLARWTEDFRFGWSMAVATADSAARGLRLHLKDVDLPLGLEMYVYGLGNGTEIHGPYTGRGPDGSGTFWTNTVYDTILFVEIHSSEAMNAEKIKELGFIISEVAVLGGPNLHESQASPTVGRDTSCLTNTRCSTEWAYEGTAELGMTALLVPTDSGTIACSGGLINDSDPSTTRPFILTSFRCIESPSAAAGTEFYWRYASPTCGSNPPPINTFPRTLGATILAQGNAQSSSDFSFLEMKEPAPGGSTYLGWTTADPAAGASICRIAYPSGLGSHYSRTTFTGDSWGGCSDVTQANFIRSSRAVGTVTSGAMGAPAVNSSGQVMGQLYGLCSVGTIDPCGQGADTVDGKFSKAYEQISSWLGNPPPPPPSNDNFGSAINLGSTTYTNVGGINVYATKEGNEPNHAGNPGGKSVWWRWTAPAVDGTVYINTFSSSFDTTLAVYRGTALAALVQSASNNDSQICGTSCLRSRVAFKPTPLTGYYIAVDGVNANGATASGGVALELSFVPNSAGGPKPLDVLFLSEFGQLWLANNTGQGVIANPVMVDSTSVDCEQDTNNGKIVFAGDVASPVGDGLTDIIHVKNGRVNQMVNRNNLGNLFNTAFRQSEGWVQNEAEGFAMFRGEFNGDARPDILQLEPNGVAYAGVTYNGQFRPPTLWGETGFVHKPSEGRFVGVGDFNGDGRSDLVHITPQGDSWVAVSIGSRFSIPIRWGVLGFQYNREAGYGLHTGDFNRDGFADIAQTTPGLECWVALSYGSGFRAPYSWGATGFLDRPSTKNTVYAGDWDGDGFTDLLQFTDQGELWYARSIGTNFGISIKAGTLGFFPQPTGPNTVLFGNFY